MKKKIIIQWIKIVVSVCLITFLLHRIGLRKIADQLRSMDAVWLVGALILFTASHFLGSCQWWMLLRGNGIRIPWRKTVSFYFVGLFFNNFLISNLGGDFFRMMDVRRHSNNGTGAVATVLMDRFAGLFVLSALAILSMLWMLFQESIHSFLRLPLTVLIAGWVFMLLFLFNKKFAKPLAWMVGRIVPNIIKTKAREVYSTIHNFGRRRYLLVRILLVSLVVQSARILTHYILARSLGVAISPLYFFLFIPIVAIMASLPVSLGGLGIREQTGIVLFGLVGIAASQAFSIEFAAYLVAVASSIPGGIIFAGRQRVSSGNEEILDDELMKEQSHEVV